MDDEQYADQVGVPPPPPTVGLGGWCAVVWARVNEPVRMICMSDAVYGRELHWVGGMSQLCEGPKSPCPLCKLEYKKLWYAWLLGHCMNSGEVILAQIPLESYRRCPAIQQPGLRGRMMRLERPERARAKVQITLIGSATHNVAHPVTLETVESMLEESYIRMRKQRGAK